MSTDIHATDQPNIQLPFTTSHAFLIGINAYEHLTPLSTAVNDATVIAERLANQHGFQVHPPLLDAKHESIRKLLTVDIPKLVGEDDRVLFYFAGHGIALDSETGPNGYLVAADTKAGKDDTLIPMQLLHDSLTKLPCRHGLVILDCCFSGAFKWSSGFRDVVFDLPKVIYEERFWRYCKDPAWQVITSAAHDQKAVDIITNQSLGLRETNGGMHSPFAESLLHALGGAGDTIPAGEGDGVITATELYSYLRDSVEEATVEGSKRQSPSIFNLQRHDKGEFIFLNPNHRFNLPPTPDRNPFMGLSSYDEGDASLFYGRDRVVETILSKAQQSPLIVVSGASGTGKSSVIKAGVLPQLRKQDYTILPIIRPGKEPMQTLATELSNAAQALAANKCILVVDQYEELITQCLDPAEREAFEQQLADWLQKHNDLRILLSVRSDFEPQFESAALAKWWQSGRYVVPSFNLEEIREVITKPAAQAVLFYEPADLVEQLSEEVSQAPGALPLLSFTLSELYHAYLQSGRQDRSLALEDYEKLGGVIGALRTRADAEYRDLSPAEQSSMRKLMLRMVSLEGGELAGKRVYAEELQFSNAAESTRLKKIAEKLVSARLLLQGTDGQGRAYIEPAHDALVRAWARLWEWIKTVGEEKITLQYKLSQAVNDYHQLLKTDAKKARNLLWNSNPRLDLLKAELDAKEHGLNAQEEAFVRSSVKRRSARQRNGWIIAITVMLGLAALTVYAFNQRDEALNQQQIAEQRKQEVQDSARVAAQQRTRADREAVKAFSNALANQSALQRLNDPTVAFRLAEVSLQITPDNILSYGALLNAFYTSTKDDRAGLMYQKVSNPPRNLFLDSRYTEREREGIPYREIEDFGVFRNQSSNSPRGGYYLMINHAHHGSNKLEIFDFGKQQYHTRVMLDLECLFSKASFSPDDRFVVIPQQNVLELCRPNNINQVEHRLFAPQAIRQAVFDQSGRYLYAQSYSGEYYRWDLNGLEMPILTNNGDFSNISDVYFGLLGDIVINFDKGRQWIQWKKENGRWKKTASSDDGNLSAPTRVGEGFTIKGEQFGANAYQRRSANDFYYEKNISNPLDANRYEHKFLLDRRIVEIRDKRGTNQWIQLSGHTLPIQSISISSDGKRILTTSNLETIMWDWSGYEIFRLDRGGVGGFHPKEEAIWLILADPENEFAEMARNKLELISIGQQTLLEWANNHNIYKLSAGDRQKFGVDD